MLITEGTPEMRKPAPPPPPPRAYLLGGLGSFQLLPEQTGGRGMLLCLAVQVAVG